MSDDTPQPQLVTVVPHLQTPQRIPDTLCPTCLNPSLVSIDIVTISDTGVTDIGQWLGCHDCDLDDD